MSDHVILIDNASDWKPDFPVYPVVAAKDYLTDPAWSLRRDLRVVNLCRSRKYLGMGYYCSLLAEARGHKVIPTVRTIQDLSRKAIYSLETEDLDERIHRIFSRRRSGMETTRFELTVFFGECAAKNLEPFARELFETFRAPILRVEFELRGTWRVAEITSVPLAALRDDQQAPFFTALERYLSKRWARPRSKKEPRYDLAILVDPDEALPPSNARAIQAFVRAAKAMGVNAETIGRKDYARLGEFDGLLIRETTSVDDHTYRFARKAAAEGMVVIDDPDSILRCTNKIYLAELLQANKVPAPKTVVLRQETLEEVEQAIPYPLVLKIPDGSFSRGIYKVANRAELKTVAAKLFKDSELLLAQEFTPTEFDWRIGILNRKPLYVCQYGMAKGHWQIVDHTGSKPKEGTAKSFTVDEAPKKVLQTALRAANLIGDGLYGVDLKETANGVLVIEVNDNPNIDAGVEDAGLGPGLYQTIIAELVRRMEVKRTTGWPA